MKILVPVKRVVDFNVKVRVKADGSGVDLANVKMSMNPFDEIAVEEALRLREAGTATEVVVVSVGEAAATDTLRTGRAMGADRGLLVTAPGRLEPRAVAKVPKPVVDKETQEMMDVVRGRLIKNFGYDEVSATDVLNFVASIFARGDVKS